MPRPKTDEEIQAGWGPLQWEFKKWYDSQNNFLYSVLIYDMPWVPIGTSNYGGFETYYALRPKTNLLQPDRKEEDSDVVGYHILTMPLEPKSRSVSDLPIGSLAISSSSSGDTPSHDSESGSSCGCDSTTQGGAKQSSSDEKYLIFAQIGALYVFGGDYTAAAEKGFSLINQGPWWRNGFIVVIKLSNKGEAGGVYIVYNDAPVKEEEEEEEDYNDTAVDPEDLEDDSPDAQGHKLGRLHPKCKEEFIVAKIADSMDRLGDLNERFVFDPIAHDKRPLISTKIVDDNKLGRFILHANPPKTS
ncbi:hypothetical protein IL306_005329 [Fusarium sp. DS 682]|nr:hypothetical protein IL306_005329 [Fusarium sp. DS 682]